MSTLLSCSPINVVVGFVLFLVSFRSYFQQQFILIIV